MTARRWGSCVPERTCGGNGERVTLHKRVENGKASPCQTYCCSTDVRNDWVKKKPDSQKAEGGPSLIHLSNIASRCLRSDTYAPSGFNEGYLRHGVHHT